MKESHEYHTLNKERILDFVNAQKDKHFTANDIYRYFSLKEQPISLPTIYRQLERLTNNKVLTKYRTADIETAFYYKEMSVYDNFGQATMKCRDCGKSFPLVCRSADELAEHITAAHHFRIRLGETVFNGQCEKCANLT